METLCRKFINRYGLAGKTIICAVSGGVDSLAMLAALAKTGLVTVVCAHVDHHKRPASWQEAVQLATFCAERAIPFEKADFYPPVVGNFQAQAREFRLKFFSTLADKYAAPAVFLAHHLEDDIETVLIQHLRQAGPESRAGMLPRRRFRTVYLYRPFLAVRKADLYAYAAAEGLPFSEDASNFEPGYRRNKLRLSVLAKLYQRYPDYPARFRRRKAALLAAAFATATRVAAFVAEHAQRNGRKTTLELAQLFREEQAFQEELLFALAKPFRFSRAQIGELLKQLAGTKANILWETAAGALAKEYDRLVIYPGFTRRRINLLLATPGSSVTAAPQPLRIALKSTITGAKPDGLWYTIENLPVTIRNVEADDSVEFGNVTKKVNRLFIDEKVGITDRLSALAIISGDKIIAVWPLLQKARPQDGKYTLTIGEENE